LLKLPLLPQQQNKRIKIMIHQQLPFPEKPHPQPIISNSFNK